MAYRLNLADNRLPVFDQSRLPITDIISVLSFTDTDNRFHDCMADCLYTAKNRCPATCITALVTRNRSLFGILVGTSLREHSGVQKHPHRQAIRIILAIVFEQVSDRIALMTKSL